MIALAFLHPALLWGLGLCAVPIIIHILNRRRFRRIPWAAMEFLLAAMRRNRRRMWLEELLLLLLRIAAVALLVLLVARPISSGTGLLAELAGDRGIHHVILLDDSASMGQTRAGKNLLSRGVDTVKDLLKGLLVHRRGDRLSVCTSSQFDQPLLDGRALTQEALNLVDERLATATTTGLRLNAIKFFHRINRTIRKLAGPREQKIALYLISDFRRADWTNTKGLPAPEITKVLSTLSDREIETTCINLEGNQETGAGITSVKPTGALLAAGVPIEITTTIRNQGTTHRGPVKATVTDDAGVRPLPPTPPLAPGETAEINFRSLFPKPGDQHLTITLPGDDMVADNSRHLALTIKEAALALVVADPGQTGSEGPGFYLSSALDPGTVRCGFHTDICPPAEAATRDLSVYDIVILAGVAAPHPTFAKNLQGFVKDGGGLLLFTGPNVVPPAWNRVLGNLLPLPLGDPRLAGDDPPRGRFSDPENQLIARAPEFFANWLQQTTFRGHTRPGGPLAESATVLAHFDNPEQDPLFIQQAGKAGKVLLATVAADAHWSNWVGDHLFPLFLQEAAGWSLATPPLSRWNLLCGEPLEISIDTAKDQGRVDLLLPGSSAPRALRAERSNGTTTNGIRVRYTATINPGIYAGQILPSTPGPARKVLRAINLDPLEGSLEQLPRGTLENLYPAARLNWFVAEETETMAKSGTRDKTWRVVAALLLLILLIETMFGRRVARGGLA